MHRSYVNPQQGFTLLEVLVAVLILSFGMLGLVGMQALALQSVQEAKYYTQASNLARELAEMMRGNPQVATQSEAGLNPYLTNTLQTGNSTCLQIGSSCATPLQIAQAQMDEWREKVRTTLPGARAVICFDTAPYDAGGLPQWDCTPSAAGTNDVVVLKLGWTLRHTDRSVSDAEALITAESEDSRPQIIVPVTGGHTSTS